MEDVDAAEQLFLLEILVEKVTFRKATLMKYYQTKDDALLPLMVSIKFCGLPPFEISQEAVRSPNSLDFGKVGEFNCGESCLFSMDISTLTRNIRRGPLQMTVVRKHFDNSPPDVIGSAQATLPESMIQTIQNVTVTQDLPLSSAYEDTVNIRSDDIEDAGFITLFVRLSCFGQSIITQFKLMKETKSFLFKSAKADAPVICDTLESGVFPLNDPTGMLQPAPGEMLAFGDFGIGSVQRLSIQKPLYGLCSGDANIITSSDIDSFLKSFRIRTQCGFILQNFTGCPISKFCPLTVGKNVSINFSGLVTVISPGKAPVLSTEHLRGGGCKGEQPNGQGRTVTFCGNSGNQQAGPCYVSASFQRLCCCEACTNTEDVTPPRYLPSIRSIEDVVPVTPIICTQDELIDPDMEQELDAGAQEERTRKWKDVFCYCQEVSEESETEEEEVQIYKTTNPPIRYDTTSSLTAAAEGERPVPLGQLVVTANPLEPTPPIRYNTTGALTRCQEITRKGEFIAANPLIRYDTTGALTVASGGRRPVPLGYLVIKAKSHLPNPPLRYNTTSALTRKDFKYIPVYKTSNPPIRYDTTGALTDAARGWRPVPKGFVVNNAHPDAPNPPVRYNTTSALSPAYIPPTKEQLRQEKLRKEQERRKQEEAEEEEEEEEAEAEEEETFVALYEEKDVSGIDSTLERLFPQYFVPDTFLEQELECLIRKTRKRKKSKKPKKSSYKSPPRSRPFLPPGVLIGHRHCVEWEPRVPKTKGWLWNGINGICGLPFREGWRPGAVRRSVAGMFYDIDKKGKKREVKIEVKDKPQMPPTLHIAKKKGIYYITMRPLDMPQDDPTPPITFRLPPLAEGEVDMYGEDMSSGSSDLEIEFCAPGTCPPEFPPKDICIQCSLSQGLVTTASSTSGSKKESSNKVSIKKKSSKKKT